MANVDEDRLRFGEIIDKSLFEERMVQVALQLRKLNKSVFDLEAAKDEMSPQKDKYVLINIFNSHASIVVVDKELFDTLVFKPVWGQMIDGSMLSFLDCSGEVKRMLTIPQQQYHVCLNESNSGYILNRNMYYMPWLIKSRSYYVGETALGYLYLQLLCLTVVPSRYRLIIDDCLEFAKRFAREIAIRENSVRETEVEVLFRTLHVSEDYTSATLEQASRNNPKSGLSGAVSYFMSFKVDRLLFALGITIAVAVGVILMRH